MRLVFVTVLIINMIIRGNPNPINYLCTSQKGNANASGLSYELTIAFCSHFSTKSFKRVRIHYENGQFVTENVKFMENAFS